jgi:hypothetical protein
MEPGASNRDSTAVRKIVASIKARFKRLARSVPPQLPAPSDTDKYTPDWVISIEELLGQIPHLGETPGGAQDPSSSIPTAQRSASGAPIPEVLAAPEDLACEEPAVKQPVVNQPAAEVPTAERPIGERPTVEEPVAPGVEAPGVESLEAGPPEPAFDEPASDEPGVAGVESPGSDNEHRSSQSVHQIDEATCN